MKQIFSEITMETKGQGLYNFTNKTLNWLDKQKINNGILFPQGSIAFFLIIKYVINKLNIDLKNTNS